MYIPDPGSSEDIPDLSQPPDFRESWFRAGTNLYVIERPAKEYLGTCVLEDSLSPVSVTGQPWFPGFSFVMFADQYVNCDFKSGFIKDSEIKDYDPVEGAIFYSTVVHNDAPPACTVAEDIRIRSSGADSMGAIQKITLEAPLPGCGDRLEYFHRLDDIWKR